MEQSNFQKYVVIKELPDAYVGTIVEWDEKGNFYSYQKSSWVSPHKFNYLTKGTVEHTPEIFCKYEEYPEHYGWINKIFSRKDIYDLINNIDGKNVNIFKYTFLQRLRELAKLYSEDILNK